MCALASVARAQVAVFSGPGAQTSLGGGGSRMVLLAKGQYVVFYNNGAGVDYVTSLDAVTFSTPQPASTTPASYGFSAAQHGNTLGFVWANSDATGFSLWYREATITAGSVTFGAPTLVTSHAVDTRGYQATLAFSAGGTPYIAALEYGQAYVGPAGPGCGALGRYRPIHYLLQNGTWMMRGYCNNFDTIRDPNSISIAPSGQNMIVSSSIDANMSTVIAGDAGELGEPWHMVPAVDHLLPGQISTVQSITTDTDVHVLYRDGAGTLSYGRQDGTNLDLNGVLADVTVLNSAARNPALSRPLASTGCYVAAYTVGNSIRVRTFSSTIASLSAERTLFTSTTAPNNLSAELENATAPALMWQDGTSILFGFAAAGARPTLAATPAQLPADGTSMIDVTSTPFLDACGAPIPEGTLVTVTTTTGSIVDFDASSEFAGTQVPADSSGRVTFAVRVGMTGGPATIAAMPITGGTNAQIGVTLTMVPPGCGDAMLDMPNGEQCDSGGVDTATCNGANCQAPRCGDGYVNFAAGEQCETGELCDMASCKFTFTIGGGCHGCGASGPGSALSSIACLAFVMRRRRRHLNQ